ncbi:MAG: glycosyltransferase family 4 protein [Pseudomonadota bacterium]
MMVAVPLRILFLTDQLSFGGAERHLVALATGLTARGHSVAVAGIKAGDDLLDALRQGGVERIACCNSRGGLDLAAIAALARIIDLEAPTVMVATSQYSLMFGVLARLRSRRPPALAFICHSMGMVQRGAGARLRFLIYRWFYGHADHLIFVSELQRAFFSGIGIAPARCTVVHNGVDLQWFVPRPPPSMRDKELLIGMCAVLREEKGHLDMLEALALLRSKGVPARLLLVGEGPMRAAIELCRDRLGLDDAVVLAGRQDDVRPFIAQCDVMVLTSHTETFPIATLEYMAMGKAVVASDVGGLREQLEHERNALLYPGGDVAALAAALVRCSEPALRARLGQQALHTVHQRFGIERMLERYELLLASLAQGRAACAPLSGAQA